MDLSKHSKIELLKKCEELGIIKCKSKNKTQLIELINLKQPVVVPVFVSSIIRCPNDVIEGRLITKEKRHELFGLVSGGSGSQKPEEFQRRKIIEGTGCICNKTSMRINFRTNTIIELSQPNILIDGFDYSEDFDGVQYIREFAIYINLKSIVGRGGHQTRSLREVYHFIEGQLNILKNTEKIFFVNILDGDEAYSCMSKFRYILNLPTFKDYKLRIYIGDLKDYFAWFMNLSVSI